MRKQVRSIFWVESVLGCIAGLLAVLTSIWPNWIEGITGLEPDGHSGSLEWVLVVGFGLAAVLLAAVASRQWRQAALAPAA